MIVLRVQSHRNWSTEAKLILEKGKFFWKKSTKPWSNSRRSKRSCSNIYTKTTQQICMIHMNKWLIEGRSKGKRKRSKCRPWCACQGDYWDRRWRSDMGILVLPGGFMILVLDPTSKAGGSTFLHLLDAIRSHSFGLSEAFSNLLFVLCCGWVILGGGVGAGKDRIWVAVVPLVCPWCLIRVESFHFCCKFNLCFLCFNDKIRTGNREREEKTC